MVKITHELAQRLVVYLKKKPYEEVYSLIAELIKQANEKDKKPVPKAPVGKASTKESPAA